MNVPTIAAPEPMRRGQISLEYLVIALLVLSLLSISLFALSHIRARADESYSRILFDKDVRLVTDTARQLCLLGPGNSREIELEQPLQATYSNGQLHLARGPWSFSTPLSCEMASATLTLKTILKNEEGRIGTAIY